MTKGWLQKILLGAALCSNTVTSFQSGSSMTRTPKMSVRVQRSGIPAIGMTRASYFQHEHNTQNTNRKNSIEIHAENVNVMDSENPPSSHKKKLPFPIVLWRFTRPHTLIGSALAIPALHIFAAPTLEAAFTSKSAISILYAMIPSLLMNLYITGLNQITDVEIDKVNKPNLPIAAGDLSPRAATIIVTVSLLLSLALSVLNPILSTQGLNIALWGSMILGTMYSMQPFRLKRFPLLAAFCIVAVRGTIINAGFYAHAKAAAFSYGSASVTFLDCLMENKCFLSSLFFAVFGVVIGE